MATAGLGWCIVFPYLLDSVSKRCADNAEFMGGRKKTTISHLRTKERVSVFLALQWPYFNSIYFSYASHFIHCPQISSVILIISLNGVETNSQRQ